MNKKLMRTMWKFWLLDKIPVSRPIVRFFHRNDGVCRREVFGLNFKTPIGIGPGFDQKGSYYNSLACFGFGFVEIGPIRGNRKKIREMVQNIHSNLAPLNVIGANIINQPNHTGDELVADYVNSFSLVYDFAHFFVLDISKLSLETAKTVMEEILDARISADQYKPVLIRVSREIYWGTLDEILDYCMFNGIDGIVAGTLDLVRHIHDYTKGRFPIIGYGNIRNAEDASVMLASGASLIEVSSALVEFGPGIAGRILRNLPKQ